MFSASQLVSPLAGRPYDLRHAAVSTWLGGGIEPTRAAEWAGYSVHVLCCGAMPSASTAARRTRPAAGRGGAPRVD